VRRHQQGQRPIPTTRTQFPGNESYYASETFLPNYAAPGAVGHRYWGQKGRKMEEVAVWEDDGMSRKDAVAPAELETMSSRRNAPIGRPRAGVNEPSSGAECYRCSRSGIPAMRNRDRTIVGRRLGAFACAQLLVVACVQNARAEAPPVHFSVDPRAKGCPTEAELRREVERQIGDEAPSLEHGPAVAVHIEVVEGGGLRARLDVDEAPASDGAGGAAASGRHRSQTLRAPAYACRDLSSAAAIAVSLVFRAAAGARGQPGVEPPAATDATRSDVARTAEPPEPASRPPARPSARPLPAAPARSSEALVSKVRHSLFAGALAGKTVGPGLGAGTIVGYAATWHERWSLVAEASATLPRVASGARDAGVVVTSRTLSLAPCAHYGVALGCAFVSAGSLVGSGTQVRVPETQRFVQVEVGLRVGARIPLARPFALRTELRSGIPLVRSRFSIGGDTVWETPVMTVTASVSFETIF
jgi:hypothetical protein